MSEKNDDIELADGFEDAFIGYGQQHQSRVAVYDTERCISIIQLRDGLSENEAIEHFQFNVQGTYVGESTPVFIYSYE